MKNQKEETTITPESVLASVKEMFAVSASNFDRELKKQRTSFDREMKQSRLEFNQRMKKLDEMIGGISTSNRLFAEDCFYNSIVNGSNGDKKFFGECFHTIRQNIPGIEAGFEDEYDILMLNGKSVGIIEVKYRARLDDVSKVIKKAASFRVNFPKYTNHQVYLGLASMIFNQRLEDECKKQGIAIVKQVNDTLVVNDGHLKVY